jgi:adenylate kinase
MKVIAVTGTPGTGKTTIAKRMAKQKGCKYLDVTKLVKENKLYDSYDRKKKAYDVDVKKLNRFLIKTILYEIPKKTKCLVIDSHLSHYLPARYVDLCIVTKTDLKKLKKRLEKRGYSAAKVRENMDAEIFDVCLNEAKEEGHKIKIIKN